MEEIRPSWPARRRERDAAPVELLPRIPDAARVLGIGRTTLYKLTQAGDVHIVRSGQVIRVSLIKPHLGRGCRAVAIVNDITATLCNWEQDHHETLVELLADTDPHVERDEHEDAASEIIAVIRGE